MVLYRDKGYDFWFMKEYRFLFLVSVYNWGYRMRTDFTLKQKIMKNRHKLKVGFRITWNGERIFNNFLINELYERRRTPFYFDYRILSRVFFSHQWVGHCTLVDFRLGTTRKGSRRKDTCLRVDDYWFVVLVYSLLDPPVLWPDLEGLMSIEWCNRDKVVTGKSIYVI